MGEPAWLQRLRQGHTPQVPLIDGDDAYCAYSGEWPCDEWKAVEHIAHLQAKIADLTLALQVVAKACADSGGEYWMGSDPVPPTLRVLYETYVRQEDADG